VAQTTFPVHLAMIHPEWWGAT